MKKFHLQVGYDDMTISSPKVTEVTPEHVLLTLWYSIIFGFIWFNLVSSPFLILWPELNED